MDDGESTDGTRAHAVKGSGTARERIEITPETERVARLALRLAPAVWAAMAVMFAACWAATGESAYLWSLTLPAAGHAALMPWTRMIRRDLKRGYVLARVRRR